MPRTKTVYIDLKNLAHLNEASPIVRLMMVCNDVSMADAKLGEAYHEQIPANRDWAATLYFDRLLCGHLNETMAIIEELRSGAPTRKLLRRCSEHCQACFEKLASCLKDGANHDRFKQVVKIRNKVSFHYDEKLVQRALMDRASTAKKPSSITTSNDVRKIRYKVADDILGTLMVHHIWGAKGDEMNDRLDEALSFTDSLVRALLEFGSEFVTTYVRENASA
jgi:hypothetical protein